MSGVQHMRSELLVRCGQASDAGLKPSNDDSLGIRIPEGPALATKGITSVIADGVSANEQVIANVAGLTRGIPVTVVE